MASKNGKNAEIQQMKSAVSNFADNTSCHGIGSIARSKRISMKILWAVIVLTAMVILLVQLTSLFQKYYSYPTSTKIEVGTSELEFPSVTVCNMNSMRKSMISNSTNPRYQSLRKLYELAEAYHAALSKPGNSEDIEDMLELPDVDGGAGTDDISRHAGEVDAEYQFRRQFDFESAKLSGKDFEIIGHHKEIFIQKCIFMGKECSASNFTNFFHSKYGLCYTFNSNEYWHPGGRKTPLSVKRSGRDYGLNLVLNIEYMDYMPIKTAGYGARLVIHDFGTFASPLGHGVSIPAGFSTSMALNLKRIHRLSHPYGKCGENKAFYNNYGKKYTQQACERLCRHLHIFGNCRCYKPGHREYYPYNVPNLMPCSKKKYGIDCVEIIEEKFLEGVLNCPCLQPCQEELYQHTISVHQWPEKKYRKVIAKQACQSAMEFNRSDMCEILESTNDKELRNNFVSMRVYYRDLNFEYIRQTPEYPMPSFLADIGGTLGLWAGISVLTGAEVMVLMFTILRHLVNFLLGRKQAAKSEKPEDGSEVGDKLTMPQETADQNPKENSV